MSGLRAMLAEALDDPATRRMLAERLAPELAILDREAHDRPGGGWLTTPQAAEHLGMNVSTVREMAASGELPSAQDGPGCRRYFRAAELDRWRLARG